MNITFLVGNGFDQSAGLRSSYRQFFEWYCRQPSEKEIVKWFKHEIESDMENWSDFEAMLGQFTKRFPVEQAEHFLTCYEDAHTGMVNYLNEQERNFGTAIFAGAVRGGFRDGILNFYRELSPSATATFQQLVNNNRGANTTVRFLSFNYTSLLDECVKAAADQPLSVWNIDNTAKHSFSLSPDVVHVNGTLTKYPTLGLDDVSQVANRELLSVPGLELQRSIIKPESVAALGELWHDHAARIINSSNIICVWGMSLGKTDAKWWRQLSNWLAGDKGRQLLLFWHEKDPPGTIFANRRFRYESGIRDRFLSFSSMNNVSKQAIAGRIHIVINTETVLRVPQELRTERADA